MNPSTKPDTGVTVDVEVTNNDQPADGTSQITVTVTVCVNGVPYPNVPVYLELLQSQDARFSNGSTKTMTRTQTGDGGTVKGQTPPIPFTDTTAEMGLVYAHVNFGDGVGEQKPFRFVKVN